MVPLSILELGGVREGSDRRAALEDARHLAQHAERLGYRRFWVAEHHNMPTVTTAATSVVLAYVASHTKTIRVGAGGIMLPNHAPYVIAEQFGTLETLFPGRIDLGLGRAPGTDQHTLRALRRSAAASEQFPDDVRELQAFLGPLRAGQTIEAVPGSNTNVPLWILGSSTFGAQLAAAFGLPYAFASHFAPQALQPALAAYRRQFQPSSQQPRPHAMVAVNVIAAPTDEEARFLATSQQIMFTNMVRGVRGLFAPPIPDMDAYWTSAERAYVEQMLACTLVGSPDSIRQQLVEFVARTGADEIIVTSNIFDPALRIRSFALLAEVAGIEPARGSA